MDNSPHVAVIGAGAFGGWTALHLLERGARVTLVDAYTPGHPRGTSNDESRLIRCGYGLKPLYTDWTLRALELWKHWQRKWRTELFVNAGVLWLCQREDDYVRASLEALAKRRIPHERLTRRQLARRWPQVGFAGIRFGYFEPRAGFLRARQAVMRVAQAVAKHPRGRVLLASASSPAESILLSTGKALRADFFVYACGPWLPQLFPHLLGRRVRVTKQEILYFGVPPGDARFSLPALPCWVDIHADFYGVPAGDGRGIKIAWDVPGPPFDPTRGERVADPRHIRAARRHLARRFPGLAGAPLSEARVCQYERTPDSNFVIDRHPDHANVWLVGGGSGHGFKLGPAVGEFVAEQILDSKPRAIPDAMRLGASAWPASGAAPRTRSF